MGPTQKQFGPVDIMLWPCPRILVLHVTVILGLLLVNIPATTSPDVAKGVRVVLLLVALKLIAEVLIDVVGFSKTVSSADRTEPPTG